MPDHDPSFWGWAIAATWTGGSCFVNFLSFLRWYITDRRKNAAPPPKPPIIPTGTITAFAILGYLLGQPGPRAALGVERLQARLAGKTPPAARCRPSCRRDEVCVGSICTKQARPRPRPAISEPTSADLARWQRWTDGRDPFELAAGKDFPIY